MTNADKIYITDKIKTLQQSIIIGSIYEWDGSDVIFNKNYDAPHLSQIIEDAFEHTVFVDFIRQTEAATTDKETGKHKDIFTVSIQDDNYNFSVLLTFDFFNEALSIPSKLTECNIKWREI